MGDSAVRQLYVTGRWRGEECECATTLKGRFSNIARCQRRRHTHAQAIQTLSECQSSVVMSTTPSFCDEEGSLAMRFVQKHCRLTVFVISQYAVRLAAIRDHGNSYFLYVLFKF